jgi:hypothetical protein
MTTFPTQLFNTTQWRVYYVPSKVEPQEAVFFFKSPLPGASNLCAHRRPTTKRTGNVRYWNVVDTEGRQHLEYLSNCPKCPRNCPRWTIAWTMDFSMDIFNYLMDIWTFPWTFYDNFHLRGHMDIFVDISMDISMDIFMDIFMDKFMDKFMDTWTFAWTFSWQQQQERNVERLGGFAVMTCGALRHT